MKVKLTVPDTLAEIKLSQYQKFLKTTKDSEDAQFINKQLVGIFCNIDDDVVNKIKAKDFNNIVSIITTMLSERPPLKRLVKHNGKDYGFIPNLEDITLGEQVDIETNINDWSKMHLVMGVMYRPVNLKKGDKYLIDEYKESQGLDLTMDVVFGAILFFYRLVNDLLNSTQSYINQAVKNPKMLQTLEESGVGISQFTDSLTETFLNLKQLVNLDYTRL